MVRILVASRRPCEAEALATSSYGTNFDQPWSADTLVSAAVSVVLPWSTWPMVPTFTCGFLRSNFSLAMVLLPRGAWRLEAAALVDQRLRDVRRHRRVVVELH